MYDIDNVKIPSKITVPAYYPDITSIFNLIHLIIIRKGYF
jgi:hypothetical protein